MAQNQEEEEREILLQKREKKYSPELLDLLDLLRGITGIIFSQDSSPRNL
jgi:hypothetical protein